MNTSISKQNLNWFRNLTSLFLRMWDGLRHCGEESLTHAHSSLLRAQSYFFFLLENLLSVHHPCQLYYSLCDTQLCTAKCGQSFFFFEKNMANLKSDRPLLLKHVIVPTLLQSLFSKT